MRLVERSYVKNLLGIALADTMLNAEIDNVLDFHCQMVEEITDRVFNEVERTEYHQSYEQSWADPEPQIIFLKAAPIDTGETFTIVYAPYEQHATQGTTLVLNDDYWISDETKGIIHILKASGNITTNPYIALGSPSIAYAPRGFQITYTGGYADSAGSNTDPLHDYGIPTIPVALKQLIAGKAARDFKDGRFQPSVWTADERMSLKPWFRRGL